MSARSVSAWALTEMNSPTAIDIAPPTSPATPAVTIADPRAARRGDADEQVLPEQRLMAKGPVVGHVQAEHGGRGRILGGTPQGGTCRVAVSSDTKVMRGNLQGARR